MQSPPVAPPLRVQLIPAGLDVTVPLPVPAVATVSVCGGGGAAVKVAVTLRAALIVTTQGPVPVQAPLQPSNVSLPLGVAVSVTVVPLA